MAVFIAKRRDTGVISLENLGKVIVVIALGLFAVGGLLFLFGKLGLQRLPGDILIKRDNFVFWFPLGLSILISIILTVFLLLLNLFFRR